MQCLPLDSAVFHRMEVAPGA